ncbi:hypothetical protein ACPA9J_14455 [Pseudomonas aeruginosa]
MILFTSGATGQPKGIELSQQAMLHAYRIGRDCLGIGGHTRSGCFYRISGLGILGINFLFPAAVRQRARCSCRCTAGPTAKASGNAWNASASVSSTWCRRWSAHMVKEGSPPPRPCRCSACSAVAGSARLDADLQAAFQRDYAALADIYGLSECGFAFLFGKRRGDAFDQLGGTCRRPGTQADRPDGRPLEGDGSAAGACGCARRACSPATSTAPT